MNTSYTNAQIRFVSATRPCWSTDCAMVPWSCAEGVLEISHVPPLPPQSDSSVPACAAAASKMTAQAQRSTAATSGCTWVNNIYWHAVLPTSARKVMKWREPNA